MVCRVRYLSSAGIQASEVTGVEALAKALPEHWLLYASLTCFPPNQHSFEMDLVVVTHDRVLILELKNHAKKVVSNGDTWVIGRGRRTRSPVAATAEKARKLKSVLLKQIPELKGLSVDHRIVMTGAGDFSGIAADEKAQCWTLTQACSIGERAGYDSLLPRAHLTSVRPCTLVAQFETAVNDARIFRPTERSWDGYVTEEENVFLHGRGVWSEHRVERHRDGRFKGLLRLWDFGKLPVGLNVADTRRLVADREAGVIAHLRDTKSWLVERAGVLTPIGAEQDEILTQHYEILSLETHATSLRRFLERHRESLTRDQRIDLATTILNAVSELHQHGVAHRDLAAHCIWVSKPTQIALTGFMSAQVEGNTSVADWLDALRGYSEDLPEDAEPHLRGAARRRDVFAVSKIASEILSETAGENLPDWASSVLPVLERAQALSPVDRYATATELAEAFVSAFADAQSEAGASRLDAFETATVPMQVWPDTTQGLQSRNGKLLWPSPQDSGNDLIIRVWPSARRSLSLAMDLSILQMLDGADCLRRSPTTGLPVVRDFGLSMMGAFVAVEKASGQVLTDWRPVDAVAIAQLAMGLCSVVERLHALGLSHADLSPQNVIVGSDATSVSLIDLFDLPASGQGRVRNLAYAPQDWELHSDAEIDRFATAKIILELLASDPARELEDLQSAVRAELDRLSIQSLEPIIVAARRLVEGAEAPPVEIVSVKGPVQSATTLQTPEGVLWVSTTGTNETRSYTVSSYDAQLSFSRQGDLIRNVQVQPIDFRKLSSATSQTRAPLKVMIDRARDAVGMESLAERISVSVETKAPSPPASSVDVPQLWSRTVELEEDLYPELTIRERAAGRSAGLYQYETDRTFDFDQESEVEVQAMHKGRMKRVGLLDLTRLTEAELGIKNQVRTLDPYDVVRLVDRRSKVSLERRQRAVGKILARESKIPDLIDYFDPAKVPLQRAYALQPLESDLEVYGLNEGQKRAFRSILSTGPLGLLQGPPGTGKTHFIAALIHWLITKGGAQKVLLASQSHEAVNAGAEGLIKAFKMQGGRLDLLRIGSRGLSDRLRPYHTTSLRESFEQRFLASLKSRTSAASSALGVPRALMHDLVDMDLTLLRPIERLRSLRRTLADERLETTERRRLESRERGLIREVTNAASRWLGDAGPELDLEVLPADARVALLSNHPKSSPADLEAATRILALSEDWMATLRSGHRNFDEFLAKTRSIVAGTCVGLGQTRIKLEASEFDWVIIDEAARCTSSELAVPMQLGKRVLLVGDHLQLPPTIAHELATAMKADFSGIKAADLRRSDFERAFTSAYGRATGQVLVEQYRMPPAICELVSDCFYSRHHVTLEPSPERKGDDRFAASGVPRVLADEILWVDTSGEPDSAERRANNNRDSWNEAEVEAILRILQKIHDDAVFSTALCRDEDPPIGVICMYKRQKRRIEQAFADRPFPESFRRAVKIDTVDAYQGKQNKIVIVSLVRNNPEHDPGHVRHPNRLNVAFSRAQERLIIVGARTMWADKSCPTRLRDTLVRIEGRNGKQPLGRVVRAKEVR